MSADLSSEDNADFSADFSANFSAEFSADLERRFGGLRRLYGESAYRRLRAARVAIVGVGGVGSWTAEALARSGVALLVLIDLDQVAESNIQRQVQALGATVGMAKVQALQQRIADIHPGCEVIGVEEFVGADNWPALLPCTVDVLVDACDQVRAKLVLAQWAAATGTPLVCVGAAGGKREPARVEVGDLRDVTHDPLLASLRQRLRQAARGGGDVLPALRCVFSREPVARPVMESVNESVSESVNESMGESQIARTSESVTDPICDAAPVDGSLNCAGYGSSVTLTATFGMVAAAEAVALLLLPARGGVSLRHKAAPTSG